jgi:hypothetical protein
LGGFITSSEPWATFADEWQAVIHRDPRIEYFKVNEAVGLTKQFDKNKGWDFENANRKINCFVDVILKHAQVRIHATIRHNQFAETRGSTAWVKFLKLRRAKNQTRPLMRRPHAVIAK